jgi:hypothetical protein
MNEGENNIFKSCNDRKSIVTKLSIHVYYSDLRRAPELKKISVEKMDRLEKLAHIPLQKMLSPYTQWLSYFNTTHVKCRENII